MLCLARWAQVALPIIVVQAQPYNLTRYSAASLARAFAKPSPLGVAKSPKPKPMCIVAQVEVEPSPIFQRDGYDVVVPRTIDFTDAILGSTLRCLKVPHETQQGPPETVPYSLRAEPAAWGSALGTGMHRAVSQSAAPTIRLAHAGCSNSLLSVLAHHAV